MPFSDLRTHLAEALFRATGPERHLSDLPTGLKDIDRAIGGLPRGVSLLAAAPAMGVSSLAMQISLQVSTRGGSQVAVFCPSEGPGAFAVRCLFGTAWRGHDLLRAQLEPRSARVAAKHLRELPKGRVWLDDGLALSSTEVVGRARTWAASHSARTRLIVVDGLHGLCDVEPDWRRAHRAVARLARLADELDASILVCAQLPHPRRHGWSWSPRLSELRCYGDALDHVQLVALLYREEYYVSETERPGEADLAFWSRSLGQRFATLWWFDKGLLFRDFGDREPSPRPSWCA